MTYSTGQVIEDGDYNLFVTGSENGTPNHSQPNVNSLWGTGNGAEIGYGQSGTLAAVAPGTEITATQWANLFNRMSTIANHQGTSISSVTLPTVGTEIEALAAINTNLQDIWDNLHNAAASGSTYNTGGVADRTTSWNNVLTFDFDIDFGTEAAMYAFFNAGGRMTLTSTRSGGTSNAKNTSWTDGLATLGTMNFTGLGAQKNIAGTNYYGFEKKGGSGSPTIYELTHGAYDYTNAYTTVLEQEVSGGAYNGNFARVRARRQTATPAIIQVRFRLEDVAGDPPNVDGTTNATLSLVMPSTTYLTDVWGTPTISNSITTA